MKKVLLAAMVLFAGASFTSCSSSDDDDNEKQEQRFDASKVMSGKWELSKIQDFPIPINHYSIQKGNTISFLEGGVLRTEGDFSVVINGDAASPMTMPFGSYKTWKANTNYKQDGTVDTGTSAVYFDGGDMYVAYFVSATEIDLVKFATSQIGMSYILTKVQ